MIFTGDSLFAIYLLKIYVFQTCKHFKFNQYRDPFFQDAGVKPEEEVCMHFSLNITIRSYP